MGRKVAKNGQILAICGLRYDLIMPGLGWASTMDHGDRQLSRCPGKTNNSRRNSIIKILADSLSHNTRPPLSPLSPLCARPCKPNMIVGQVRAGLGRAGLG